MNVDNLEFEVANIAGHAVVAFSKRARGQLDYSEASLNVVEEMVAEASGFVKELTEDEFEWLVKDFGCYFLEVARQNLGGEYVWFADRSQPVLVVGEPDFRIALLAWDKVRSRLSGDPSESIRFSYSGFAARVKMAKPGDNALYV